MRVQEGQQITNSSVGVVSLFSRLEASPLLNRGSWHARRRSGPGLMRASGSALSLGSNGPCRERAVTPLRGIEPVASPARDRGLGLTLILYRLGARNAELVNSTVILSFGAEKSCRCIESICAAELSCTTPSGAPRAVSCPAPDCRARSRAALIFVQQPQGLQFVCRKHNTVGLGR